MQMLGCVLQHSIRVNNEKEREEERENQSIENEAESDQKHTSLTQNVGEELSNLLRLF
jgi:hypothetical protein